MIRIENLTTSQVNMLDTMWALDTSEDFIEWYSCLSYTDQKMCDVLVQLIAFEFAEDILENHDYTEADEFLQKFRI